jgi:hypothetical protein
VVQEIRNKYVAIGGHHHATRVLEARVRPLPVCEAFLVIFVIVFVIIFLPAASQCADDCALLCHGAYAVGRTEPGDGDCGHGSFQGGRARTLGG